MKCRVDNHFHLLSTAAGQHSAAKEYTVGIGSLIPLSVSPQGAPGKMSSRYVLLRVLFERLSGEKEYLYSSARSYAERPGLIEAELIE